MWSIYHIKTRPKVKPQMIEIKKLKDGEAERRGARWYEVTFTLWTDCLADKRLSTFYSLKQYLPIIYTTFVIHYRKPR